MIKKVTLNYTAVTKEEVLVNTPYERLYYKTDKFIVSEANNAYEKFIDIEQYLDKLDIYKFTFIRLKE